MIETKNRQGKEIVLHGLEDEMQLEYVRGAMAAGAITPSSTGRLREVIKGAARLVYNQEKFTDEYHPRVCGVKNALAWFLCATHRRSAPQKAAVRENSASSLDTAASGAASGSSSSGSPPRRPVNIEGKDSKFVAAACQSDEPGKRCELPKLKTSMMLPSSYWDALWYAAVAEVKFLYTDIQARFGYNFEDGDYVLHDYGVDGDTMWQFTVKDLAVLLERCWMELHHTTVIAALDYRVKQKNALKALSHVPSTKQILDAEGLINIDGACPEFLWRMLWEKFYPEMKKAVRDNVTDDENLIGARSAMRSHSPKVKYGFDPRHLKCTCGPYCHCRCVCDFSSTGCSCEIARQRHGCPVLSNKKREANEANEVAENAEADRAISAGTVKAYVAAFEKPTAQACTAPMNTKTCEDLKHGKERGAEISKAYRQLVAAHPVASHNDNVDSDFSQVYCQLVEPYPAAADNDNVDSDVSHAYRQLVEPHPAAGNYYDEQPARNEAHSGTIAVDSILLPLRNAAFMDPIITDYIPRSALDDLPLVNAGDYASKPLREHATSSASQTISRHKATDPKTPVRPVKDANPLGFYGDYSGQRYPAEATFRAPPAMSPPVYGTTLAPIATHAAQFMSQAEPSPGSSSLFQQPIIRKRVNTTAAPQRVPIPVYAHNRVEYNDQVTALPEISGLAVATQPRHSSGQVNSSFPIPSRGNVRNLVSPQDSTTALPRYIKDSPPRHDSRAVPEPFPRLSNTPTGYRPFTTILPDMIADPDARAHAATAALEAYHPITPDYIDPRPSIKQRWVSAGGNRPLHEREETPPPSLISVRNVPSVPAFTQYKVVDTLQHEQQAAEEARVRSEEIERRVAAQRTSGEEGTPVSRERQSTGTGKMSETFRRMFKRSGSSVEL